MEKSFKVIVNNNSLLVIPVVTSPAVPGSFLAVAFTVGLCLNALMVFTIASSSSLWRVRLNALLLQLGLVCGLECVLNISASVAFVTALERLSRNYGVETQTICRVNVAFGHFTVTLQAVTLAALATERALALHHRQAPPPPAATAAPVVSTSASKSVAPSVRLTNLLLKTFPFLSWLYCAGLVAPIVASVQLVPVRPFSERYSCGLFMGGASGSDSEVYTGVLAVLAALLPWAVTITAVISVAWRLAAERRRRLLLEEAAHQRARGDSSIWATVGSNRDTSWPLPLLDDAVYYVIVAIIIVLYIALVVPQTISIYIRPRRAANPPIKATVPLTNLTGPSTEPPIPPDLTPIATGTYDEIFIWCRYLFSILVPIVVFSLNRELRKKCQYLFCCCCCCCCRNNSITHLTESRSASALLQKQAHKLVSWPSISRLKSNKHLSKYGRMASYRTPVLFTTSEGLHLRLVIDNMKPTKKGQLNSQPNFVCDFCDVAINAAASFDSMNTARLSKGGNKSVPKQPPRFGHDGAFEQDMHLSDHSNDDGKLREMYVDNNQEIAKNSRETNAKKVRFANSINEISRTSKDSLKYSNDISLENLWPAYNVRQPKKMYKSFGSKVSLLEDNGNAYY